MLQKLTEVRVTDNTGVIFARVIQVFSGRKVYARLGGLIRITTRTIRRLRKTKKVKSKRRRRIIFKKRRRMASIVRVRRNTVYFDGSVVRFRDNAIVLYKKRKLLKGKRFKGLSTRHIGYEKLLHKFKLYI